MFLQWRTYPRKEKKKISTLDESIKKIMRVQGENIFGPKSLCDISIENVTELHKVKASLPRSKIEILQMEKQMSKESLIKISEFVASMMKSSSGSTCGARRIWGLNKLDFLSELVTYECFTDKVFASTLKEECDRSISLIEEMLEAIE